MSEKKVDHSLFLERVLNPFANLGYLINYKDKSCGREWLMQLFNEWSSNIDSSKVCVLKGVTGLGKTAFVTSRLLNKENVIGVHYCKYYSGDRSNHKRVIMYFAHCLAKKLPEYEDCLIDRLEHMFDFSENLELIKMGTENLFTSLISAPLRHCIEPEFPLVFVIDAINTSFNNSIDNDESEIVNFLKEYLFEFPSWIKFFITDRSSNLETLLSDYNPYIIDGHTDENENDIYLYVNKRLKNIPISERELVLKNVLQKSEGSFLYAEKITDDIISGKRKAEDYSKFPSRIGDFYTSEFKHLFGDDFKFYSSKVRPLFELLVSSKDQIKITHIAKILKWENGDQRCLQDKIKDYFPIIDGYFVPTNKGLYDWLTTTESRKFRVEISRGTKLLADYYFSQFREHHWDQISEYSKKYLVFHLIELERYKDAEIVLSSKEFLKLRIKFLGVDAALRKTFYEISLIPDDKLVIKNRILCSDMIRFLLAHHRTFLYNSGLYFELKKCGFDNVQEEYVEKLWCDRAKIGWANYLYITEHFSDAVSYLQKLIRHGEVDILSNQCQQTDLLVNCEYVVDTNDLAGLHNTLGLCYRKYVDFDKALMHFECAEQITVGESIESLYEKSIAIVNIGKIDYHLFDWNKSIRHTLEACDKLEQCKKLVNDMDKLIELDLFIAEYNRLAAEACIWNKQIEDADKYLSESNRIYSIYQIRDRYYIRYHYTNAFLKIVKGEPEKSVEILTKLLEQAKSDYDKSQILYYLVIAYYLMGDKPYNEIETLLMLAATYANDIDAKIEYYQVQVLKKLVFNDNIHITFDDNEVIRKWCRYTGSLFSALKSQR